MRTIVECDQRAELRADAQFTERCVGAPGCEMRVLAGLTLRLLEGETLDADQWEKLKRYYMRTMALTDPRLRGARRQAHYALGLLDANLPRGKAS